mmetsp:Transcript_30969/g.52961  ORF Transcript_30969/g.52961 Transcript_30969/m.52961 type:complete len:132 (+) Transcript_30969:304-699(+)
MKCLAILPSSITPLQTNSLLICLRYNIKHQEVEFVFVSAIHPKATSRSDWRFCLCRFGQPFGDINTRCLHRPPPICGELLPQFMIIQYNIITFYFIELIQHSKGLNHSRRYWGFTAGILHSHEASLMAFQI